MDEEPLQTSTKDSQLDSFVHPGVLTEQETLRHLEQIRLGLKPLPSHLQAGRKVTLGAGPQATHQPPIRLEVDREKVAEALARQQPFSSDAEAWASAIERHKEWKSREDNAKR